MAATDLKVTGEETFCLLFKQTGTPALSSGVQGLAKLGQDVLLGVSKAL